MKRFFTVTAMLAFGAASPCFGQAQTEGQHAVRITLKEMVKGNAVFRLKAR